jgi:hypothetical protein
MRDLGFRTDFGASGNGQVQVVLHIAPEETARDLLDEGIVGQTQANFVAIVAAAKGLQSDFAVETGHGGASLLFGASAEILSEPWHIAALLNTLEGASFLMQEGEKFWTRVSVRAPRVLSLEEVYADLDRYLEAVRGQMTDWLGGQFEGAEETGGVWPEVPADYMFDLEIQMAPRLTPEAQALGRQLLELLDQLLAESAFEPETGCEEWLEEGRIPYPVEIDISDHAIHYVAEMPPSDFAPGLLLALDVLRLSFDITPKAVALKLREGW